MNLHPDILNDLALLYRAGEASAATRELLEREAASNPTVSRLLRESEMAAKIEVPVPDAQRRALESIGKRNRLYSTLVGFAAAFLLLPFSFAFHSQDGELRFAFLWREAPLFCLASALFGIVFGVAALRSRRLRGLD
jgi:hypothetical protein